MKTKKTIGVLFIILIILGGTFITIEVKQSISKYKEKYTFTQKKWAAEPDRRFTIVRDLVKKYDFANMTREQVVMLLGKPDNPHVGGFAVRTFDKSKLSVDLDNPSSICYITKTGGMPEDFNGFYVKFDKDGKVVDFAIIHFTT